MAILFGGKLNSLLAIFQKALLLMGCLAATGCIDSAIAAGTSARNPMLQAARPYSKLGGKAKLSRRRAVELMLK
jgi:hypothetical protein